MKSFLSTVVLALCTLTAVFGAIVSALALPEPDTNFSTTCTNISVNLSTLVLTAICERSGGVRKAKVSIDLDGCLANTNGELTTGEKFSTSCRSIRLSGVVLSARCATPHGGFNNTSIPLNVAISNKNGRLTCPKYSSKIAINGIPLSAGVISSRLYLGVYDILLVVHEKHSKIVSSSHTLSVPCMKAFCNSIDMMKQDFGIGYIDARRLAHGLIYRSDPGSGAERHRSCSVSGSSSALTTMTRRTATEETLVHLRHLLTGCRARPTSPVHNVVSGVRLDGDESRLFTPSHANSSIWHNGYISVMDEDMKIAARWRAMDKGKHVHPVGKSNTCYAPGRALRRDTRALDDEESSADVLAADQARRIELMGQKATIFEELCSSVPYQ
ncbi:hypothetical protein B0H12DRAFT_1067879 [Mycena haematopus]|nr:hypothetical protein B0H12DRAFT_1067879 [Mycena haematopus]